MVILARADGKSQGVWTIEITFHCRTILYWILRRELFHDVEFGARNLYKYSKLTVIFLAMRRLGEIKETKVAQNRENVEGGRICGNDYRYQRDLEMSLSGWRRDQCGRRHAWRIKSCGSTAYHLSRDRCYYLRIRAHADPTATRWRCMTVVVVQINCSTYGSIVLCVSLLRYGC